MKIKSIFEQISEQLFTMNDLNDAKKFIIGFIDGKNINEKDRQTIIRETNNAKTLVKLQGYLCNCLLKYEGMGVNQINKTSKEAAVETVFK